MVVKVSSSRCVVSSPNCGLTQAANAHLCSNIIYWALCCELWINQHSRCVSIKQQHLLMLNVMVQERHGWTRLPSLPWCLMLPGLSTSLSCCPGGYSYAELCPICAVLRCALPHVCVCMLCHVQHSALLCSFETKLLACAENLELIT